jgi:hypothetical protein
MYLFWGPSVNYILTYLPVNAQASQMISSQNSEYIYSLTHAIYTSLKYNSSILYLITLKIS